MKIKTLKKILLCCSCFLFLLSVVPVSALEHETYSDLVSSSNNATNLLNLGYNYESFKNKDFVIYQDNQYSFYICWGDFVFTSGILYSDNIEYVHYYRTNNGVSYNYDYQYGVDNDFKLSINHIVTSNIENIGMVSSTFQQYRYNDYFIKLLIFAISLLFAILLNLFRR